MPTRASAPATVTLDAIQVTERAAVSRTDTVSDVSGTEKAVTADPGIPDGRSDGRSGGDGRLDSRRAVAARRRWRGRRVLGVRPWRRPEQHAAQRPATSATPIVPRDAAVSAPRCPRRRTTCRAVDSPAASCRCARVGQQLPQPLSELQPDRAADAVGGPGRRRHGAAVHATFRWAARRRGRSRSDEAFYNTSFQYDRRMQDLQTLLNTSDLGFRPSASRPIRSTRLLSILSAQGVPSPSIAYASAARQRPRVVPGQLRLRAAELVARRQHDDAPPCRRTSASTSPVARSDSRGLVHAVTRWHARELGRSAQLRHSGQTGFWGLFTETTVGLQHRRAATSDPFVNVPSARCA